MVFLHSTIPDFSKAFDSKLTLFNYMVTFGMQILAFANGSQNTFKAFLNDLY